MNRLISVLVFLLAGSWSAGALVNPCSLLTPAEIESALGVKVSGFGGNSQIGPTQTCTGAGDKRMSVMLMVVTQKPGDPKVADPMGFLENQSRQSAKSINAQMEVKKFGSSILCTTLIPPKQGPYSTQCMVIKPPSMASIGILVATQQDMVSMDKLALLAEKMAGRF
jgi:hypothetical protein